MDLTKRYAKTQRAQEFLKSEEGQAVYAELCKMVEDDSYNTVSTFSPSAEDGSLLFIDKHMTYLCTHLSVKSDQYLSNLRLITKVRK
jgi:hypothetical protein